MQKAEITRPFVPQHKCFLCVKQTYSRSDVCDDCFVAKYEGSKCCVCGKNDREAGTLTCEACTRHSHRTRPCTRWFPCAGCGERMIEDEGKGQEIICEDCRELYESKEPRMCMRCMCVTPEEEQFLCKKCYEAFVQETSALGTEFVPLYFMNAPMELPKGPGKDDGLPPVPDVDERTQELTKFYYDIMTDRDGIAAAACYLPKDDYEEAKAKYDGTYSELEELSKESQRLSQRFKKYTTMSTEDKKRFVADLEELESKKERDLQFISGYAELVYERLVITETFVEAPPAPSPPDCPIKPVIPERPPDPQPLRCPYGCQYDGHLGVQSQCYLCQCYQQCTAYMQSYWQAYQQVQAWDQTYGPELQKYEEDMKKYKWCEYQQQAYEACKKLIDIVKKYPRSEIRAH